MNYDQRQISKELEHIPKGELNQGLLRCSFRIRRQHSLSANAVARKTAAQDLREAIAALQRDDPMATFRFDASYFGV